MLHPLAHVVRDKKEWDWGGGAIFPLVLFLKDDAIPFVTFLQESARASIKLNKATFVLKSSLTASIQLKNRGCSIKDTEDVSLYTAQKIRFPDKQNVS